MEIIKGQIYRGQTTGTNYEIIGTDEHGVISLRNLETGEESQSNNKYFPVYYKLIHSDFDKITSSIAVMLKAKNKAYGGSALKPLEIFAKHHSYGSRLDEKLARVKNSDELRKNDVADLLGGLILICKEKGWDDFSDQID
tara:strand:- start:669 stop:1088 length:420 start_codon:yes stop_codon:yes gene_type:complete